MRAQGDASQMCCDTNISEAGRICQDNCGIPLPISLLLSSRDRVNRGDHVERCEVFSKSLRDGQHSAALKSTPKHLGLLPEEKNNMIQFMFVFANSLTHSALCAC
jgi:hypothetical protein